MHQTVQWISAIGFDAFMAPLERLRLGRVRTELAAAACGRVLELGAGTGANLPYFDWGCIDQLTLTDRDDAEAVLAARSGSAAAQRHDGTVEVSTADVMRLPYGDGTFDTVIATLLFCSVDDPPAGLQEVRRVLKPGGIYLFLEHVIPDHRHWRRAFNLINPLWRRMSGGCNLNRDTVQTIRSAGFGVEWIKRDRNGVFVHGAARS